MQTAYLRHHLPIMDNHKRCSSNKPSTSSSSNNNNDHISQNVSTTRKYFPAPFSSSTYALVTDTATVSVSTASTSSVLTSTSQNVSKTRKYFATPTTTYAAVNYIGTVSGAAAPPTSSVTTSSSSSSSTLSVADNSPLVSLSSCSALSLSTISSVTSNSSSSSSSSIYHLGHSSSQKAEKRKRRASVNQADKDNEIDFEPPLAKRQQRLPSLYQSEPDSVVSSVYPSPVDELVHDIGTPTSSECLSTVVEYDVAQHDDIPDSPHSLQIEQDCHDEERDDVDDDEDDDDDLDDDVENVFISGTSSSSTCSSSQAEVVVQYEQLHPSERTPGQKYAHPSVVTNSNVASGSGNKPKVKSFDQYANAYGCLTPAEPEEQSRFCPLPLLAWGNANEVWQLMCKKDEHASCMRDAAMLEQHPGLQPRMRAILLDWLMEVCEVYKLHRETYYLAVDYLDRYLSALKKVQKTQLQLIGITCLFVAAKVEEIYPPKIGEFAYVTDGACQDADILKHEILLLQALEWSISPVTPMAWLGVYMQLNVNNRTPKTFNPTEQRNVAKRLMLASGGVTANNTSTDDAFIYPQYSGMEYVQTAQLLDLCSLDVGFAHFPYSVIAAAAMSHTFNRDTALRCSGLEWQTIEECARWMLPFFEITAIESKYVNLKEQNDQLGSKFGLGHVCPNIVTDDSHIIQTHTTTMTMIDQVWQLREEYHSIALQTRSHTATSPAKVLPNTHEGLLTPPSSNRKPLGADVEEEDDDNRVNIVDINEKTL